MTSPSAYIFQQFLACKTVSTDTRKIQPGSIFFALKGKNFNGNTFAAEALKLGAAMAVIDEPPSEADPRMVLVEDVLKSLQQLATQYRNTFNIPVLGITGSNGKTTTKELLKSVLSSHFKTHVTSGNLNNHIGVPLTILAMPSDTAFAVIEMGANKIGDNAELCEIFNPNVGLITNIGKEHLEGFGDLEGVAKGNSELYMHLLQYGGTAFVNATDEWLMRMSGRLSKRVTYGVQQSADYTFEALQLNPDIQLAYHQTHIHSHLFGNYNADNIAAACAIALHFGVPENKLAAAVEAYIPSNHRSQVLSQNDNLYYIDCYNANPSSMEMAIRNFMSMEMPEYKKVLMLGDMFEMGAHEDIEHERLMQLIASLQPSELYLCGKAFEKQQHLYPSHWFDSSEGLRNYLNQNPLKAAVVLLKGSRGMNMEKVIS